MQSNFNLQTLNTLKVACIAKYFKEITTSYQLLHLLETPEWDTEKHWILWGGSNTLFTSDFFDGLIVKINIKGIKILNETEKELLVQVGAWEPRENLINQCIQHQRWGIENLVAIPGNVGTSAVSNIGAYGQEAGETIEEVIGVHLDSKTLQKLNKAECEFAYRNSIFKQALQGKFIVTHSIFRFQKIDETYLFNTEYADIQRFFEEKKIRFEQLSPAKKLKTLTETIRHIRASKLPDPRLIWTAGSYFKNPEIWLPEWEQLHHEFPELKAFFQENETMKLSAGQLIELCWRKGHQEGKVKVSEKHALILINEGGGGKEIVDFAKKIQDTVFKKFRIMLEPEVVYCE